MSEFVQIIDVVKQFGITTAVQRVNLSIKQGEIFALLGSSGCGKSTLLRMLAGFETITSGRILLDGEDLAHVPPHQRPVNMMFQSYALFPHMTVEANIMFGLKQERVPKTEMRERVAAALNLVQMSAFAKRKPHQLSGGQQQRVALARSLVKRPKLLLLDEPMSALDKQIRQRTQIELIDILAKVGVTCILVTHDQEEAMAMADRLAVMSEGKMIQVGTPREVYEYPNSLFCAEFIGSTNLFSGKIVENARDHIFVKSPAFEKRLYVNHSVTNQLGMEVTISVRPERIAITRHPPSNDINHINWARGKVDNIVYMGSYTVYHILLDTGQTVVANVLSFTFSDSIPLTYNEQVFMSWRPAAGRVLGGA